MRPGVPESGHSNRSFKDTAAATSSRGPFCLLPVCDAGSGRGPRESLDAPENLPKERRRQVAFGKLQDEVPGMSDGAHVVGTSVEYTLNAKHSGRLVYLPKLIDLRIPRVIP